MVGELCFPPIAILGFVQIVIIVIPGEPSCETRDPDVLPWVPALRYALAEMTGGTWILGTSPRMTVA
jgi:hypothetical protein